MSLEMNAITLNVTFACSNLSQKSVDLNLLVSLVTESFHPNSHADGCLKSLLSTNENTAFDLNFYFMNYSSNTIWEKLTSI
jgi:hypothetical protein